ncbi:hypothetical protein [Comamonas sp. GB3 AK4-5]|uniref:hypothetical protein n=1 Tax=Comamonas sp. GB3 AK4-5 TaxID=3231487 RepID=UPI00351E8F91
MAHRLKMAALWLGGVFVIWAVVGATWRWRAYEPSSGDLLLGLIGVPAPLIGGYLLLQRVLGGMLQPPASEASIRTQAVAVTMPKDMASLTAQLPWLWVLGGSVKLSTGGADELRQACIEGVRPGLDAELRDAQGFPVMAARVAELDAVDAQAWWDGVDLDGVLPWVRGWLLQLPAARVRELRLLTDVLTDGAMAVEREWLEAATPQVAASAAPARFSGVRAESDAQLPTVHVRLALQAWAPSEGGQLQSLVQTWLQRAVPALHFDVQMYSGGAAEQQKDFPWPAALLQDRDGILMGSASESSTREGLWLLAAAHSDVSQPEVDRLGAAGRLYGPQRREGWIAGEGAAAMVLLRHDPEHMPAMATALQRFPVIAMARVAPAAEAAGALGPQMLAPMLESCGVPAAAVTRVLCDADHRSGPAMEAAMLLSQQFPDLSLEKDCAMVGVPSGHTAGVAALASLVLAAEFAVEEQRAAFAIALASASWRAAALLMPPGWPATKTPDGAEAEAPTYRGAKA